MTEYPPILHEFVVDIYVEGFFEDQVTIWAENKQQAKERVIAFTGRIARNHNSYATEEMVYKVYQITKRTANITRA